MKTRSIRIALSLTLAAVATGPVLAQEPGDEPPDLNPFRRAEQPPERSELEELFAKVEMRMRRVGQLLIDASAGDTTRLDEIGSSGIDELIRDAESSNASATGGVADLLSASRSQGSELLNDIDRILEIAQQQQNQQSSSGSGQPQQGGQQSQGDGQPQGDMPQQGQTPQGSQKQDSPEGPQGEQGDKPSDGETPQGNQADPPPTPERMGSNPPNDETGAPATLIDVREQWGDLPVHLRKVFRNGVSEEMPAEYRDWIDSYYRRLNRSSGSGR